MVVAIERQRRRKHSFPEQYQQHQKETTRANRKGAGSCEAVMDTCRRSDEAKVRDASVSFGRRGGKERICARSGGETTSQTRGSRLKWQRHRGSVGHAEVLIPTVTSPVWHVKVLPCAPHVPLRLASLCIHMCATVPSQSQCPYRYILY